MEATVVLSGLEVAIGITDAVDGAVEVTISVEAETSSTGGQKPHTQYYA